MRIDDAMHFSNERKTINLNWNDQNNLIDSFKDRLEDFYLKPAQQLNSQKLGFAAGLICVVTIDFLAWFQTSETEVGKRIESWLKANITDFNKLDSEQPKKSLAKRFYEEFRNGLVHEGRVKNGGQFSYEQDELIYSMPPIIIVNPEMLTEKLNASLQAYLKKVKSDAFEFQCFKCSMIKAFKRDVEIARL